MRHNTKVLLISLTIIEALLSGCSEKATPPAEVIFDKQPSPFHSVKTGESVASIAREYDMDMQELVVLNGLKPPYRLVTGQRLIVSPSTSYRPTGAYGEETVEVFDGPPGAIETSPNSGIFVSPPPAASLSDEEVTLSQQGGYLSASGVGDQPSELMPEQGLSPMAPQSLDAIPDEPAVESSAQKMPSARGFAWPIRGKVIRGFGDGQGKNKNDGINIQAPLGAPVCASKAGTVAHTGNQIGGFGNVVLIKHDNGYMTVYAHLDEVLVKRGDVVKIEQKIGTVGKSGNAKQTQLHFEVRKGTTPINPGEILK